MKRLIECVPNFSEGRDMAVIQRITDAVEAVEGVKLLDIDPGAATNRTVVTIAGEPEAVIEAAVVAGKMAAEVIDKHENNIGLPGDNRCGREKQKRDQHKRTTWVHHQEHPLESRSYWFFRYPESVQN